MNTLDKLNEFLQLKARSVCQFQLCLSTPYKNISYPNNQETSPSPLIPTKNNEDTKYIALREGDQTSFFYFYPDNYRIIITGNLVDLDLHADDHEQVWLLLHTLYHDILLEDTKKQTTSLIEGIRSISLSLDINDLLKDIIHKTLEVIPAANAGMLHLYDATIDRLVPRGIVGFDEERMEQFKLKVGESIAGKVFVNGKSRIYESYSSVIDEMSDLSKENLYHITSSKDLNGLTSLLCAPVSIDTEKIGVMIVHKFHSNQKFLEQDLFLLEGFASQAAIAIQNARLYTQVKRTLDEKAAISEELEIKNQFLNKRNEIHSELIRISLLNKGVEPIIAWLSKMINHPVYFYDYLDHSSNLPSSRSDLLYTRLNEWNLTSLSEHSQEITECTETLGDHTTVTLYPIWAGSVLLGTLIVELNQETLSELDKICIEQSNSILALELLKKQTLTQTYYKKTHEYFNDLIEAKNPEQLQKKGREFGITNFSHTMVIVMEFQASEDLQKTETEIHRLIIRIQNSLHRYEKMIFGFHQQIIILISLPGSSSSKDALDSISYTVKEWAKQTNKTIYGGIGRVVQQMHHIINSYEEAKTTLAYLIKRKQPELLSYDSLGINRLFVNHSNQEIERFLEEIFGPLLARESDHYLVNTLLHYMASNRSINETAKKLHIHANTLYQRLKKIEDILNVSFTNVEDVLRLQLACHLRDMQ